MLPDQLTGPLRAFDTPALVPRRDGPFSMRSLYDGRNLFGPELRQLVERNDRRVDEDLYFDVGEFSPPAG